MEGLLWSGPLTWAIVLGYRKRAQNISCSKAPRCILEYPVPPLTWRRVRNRNTTDLMHRARSIISLMTKILLFGNAKQINRIGVPKWTHHISTIQHLPVLVLVFALWKFIPPPQRGTPPARGYRALYFLRTSRISSSQMVICSINDYQRRGGPFPLFFRAIVVRNWGLHC